MCFYSTLCLCFTGCVTVIREIKLSFYELDNFSLDNVICCGAKHFMGLYHRLFLVNFRELSIYAPKAYCFQATKFMFRTTTCAPTLNMIIYLFKIKSKDSFFFGNF